jgi:hypothetical protein
VAVVGGATGSGGSSGGAGDGLAVAFRTASNPLLAWLVTTSGGILLFLFLLRRGTRHDDDRPGDLVFAAAVATPLAGHAAAAPAPQLLSSGQPAAVRSVDGAAATVSPKRTRKSSGKKTPRSEAAPSEATPNEEAIAAAAIDKTKALPRPVRVFDKPARKGVERAKISYRRVRISSEPDDVRSVELGRLDRGDEVEILESHEGYLRVRTPDDITGWVQRHTVVG